MEKQHYGEDQLMIEYMNKKVLEEAYVGVSYEAGQLITAKYLTKRKREDEIENITRTNILIGRRNI